MIDVFSDRFYADIKKIHIAHEFTLDQVRKCEYPRGRGAYGLVYGIEGEAQYRFFNGERVTVKRGDIFFISPESAYSIITSGSFRHYTVNFDIHEKTSSLEMLKPPYCLLSGENTEPLERGFKNLVGIWQAKATGYEMRAMGGLYELFTLFYSAYVDGTKSSRNGRLLNARKYIEQNFDKPIDLEQLAYISDMSVTNFRREWARQYSEAPIRYRDSIRLYYAKEYLNSGYYSVSEIARKCGFEDTSYFIRFFRKKTGFTPGEYKREN